MSMLSTGKIYFTTDLNSELYNDISFFIQKKANENKIGVNLAANISNNAKEKYKSENLSNRYLIFELTETPCSYQCENLFVPVYYDYVNNECRGIELSESRLPNVQIFFENILEHELISNIIFELVDGYALSEEFIFYDNIKANQFCLTINAAYKSTDKYWNPPIKINIL